uniref:Uncharacterized protein n=1 Tax=Lactuca sativa TaxID=4236 RepID=A0A9R1UV22_LACSA|nr:hypothetical protein LSAT_V11C800416470 [Lactuca sativa]
MEILKNFNVEAHEWLNKIPLKHWAKSHIYALLRMPFNEYIKEYLMKRICIVEKVMEKGIKNEACRYKAIFVGDDNKEEWGYPQDLVHNRYKLITWKEMYKFKVIPINSHNMWRKSPFPFT